MMLDANDIAAIVLTLQLAFVTTGLLLLISLPLAWWLANTDSSLRSVIQTLVALPLVLPPTVLGFYLLLAFSPHTAVGQTLYGMGLPNLAFSFTGLVIGSMLYSLPFVVQPLENAFLQMDKRLLPVAASLGANRSRIIWEVVFPLVKPGLLAAIILGFAHTVGEFGVVLMIGGNIPGETQVLSIAIFEQVELLNYDKANLLSLGLLILSFAVLFLVYRQKRQVRWF